LSDSYGDLNAVGSQSEYDYRAAGRGPPSGEFILAELKLRTTAQKILHQLHVEMVAFCNTVGALLLRGSMQTA
jgi:hypothetical protein